jgi:hypothetical protein
MRLSDIRYTDRKAVILVLAITFLGAGGCERVALLGRESVKLEPAEVVAVVERVDSASKQIHLRPNSAGVNVLAYGDETRVIYRGRDLPAQDLGAGDVIVMTVKEHAPGLHRSDFLSVRERGVDRGAAQ